MEFGIFWSTFKKKDHSNGSQNIMKRSSNDKKNRYICEHTYIQSQNPYDKPGR